MRNYKKDGVTRLRAAIYTARITQSQLALEAEVSMSALSLAASGRLPLSEPSASRVRDALAARGVEVTLDAAKGL